MINSRTICKLALSALALMTPLATQTSCSSGATDEETQSYPGVMTVDEFASLNRSFEILSAGSILIQPEILMTPSDQITNSVDVFATLMTTGVGTSSDPVQVSCRYITYHQTTDISKPPIAARMEVTFSSTTGQNDAAIIQALGLREIGVGNVLSGLIFTFDFQTQIVDISASGSAGLVVQPGEDSGGQNTDYQEQIYGKRYAIRISSH